MFSLMICDVINIMIYDDYYNMVIYQYINPLRTGIALPSMGCAMVKLCGNGEYMGNCVKNVTIMDRIWGRQKLI